MNEEKNLQHKSGSADKATETGGKKERRRLKDETERFKAMKEKLRTGKAKHAESRQEAKKNAKTRAQGRKKIRAQQLTSAGIHHQVSQSNEDNNAGVDAVNTGTEIAENGLYGAKLNRQGREEKKKKRKGGYGDKLNFKNPQDPDRINGSDMDLLALQKAHIKKQMQIGERTAEAAKSGVRAVGDTVKKAAQKTGEAAVKTTEAVGKFVASNWHVILIGAAIFLVVAVIVACFSSCTMMASGGGTGVLTTSFTAEDEDLVAVENDYKTLEQGVQNEIDSVEQRYEGYNEYNYSLAEIEHDPYELAALLTVLYENYTEDDVRAMLETVEYYQYSVTYEVNVETRTKQSTGWHYVPRTGADGKTYQSYEPYTKEEEYDYYILNTTLTNNGVRAAVDALELTDEQLWRYEKLLETQGNKPEVFSE